MEIFQVNYDTSMVTLIVKDEKEIFHFLSEEDDNFYIKDEKLFYKWSDDYSEECEISNVTSERGIIQWESH